MTLQWASCDVRTGAVIADLPALSVDWPLRHALSNYSTATAHLDLNGAPPNWERAMQEGGSWLACFDDADPDEAIQWCGFGVIHTRSTSSDVVDLDLATAEAYADRRFTGDATYDETAGRNTIMAGTIPLLADGSSPGIPIAANYAGAGPIVAPDPEDPLIWQNTDNASVLTRWNQLIAHVGGEYTIRWKWVTMGDGARGIAATLYIADHLGTPASPGLSPAVTFQLPGALLSMRQVRDYSAGKGANSVTAYSSGQGEVTPYAPPVLAPDFAGRATFEYRYQPAPSINSSLPQYAAQAIKVLAPGARSTTLIVSTARPEGRRYGKDWVLGDDIGYDVADEDANHRKILAFPGGVAGVGRAIAVEITDSTIHPILAEAEIYVKDTF